MNKIKIGIVGYGNLGRGAELAVLRAPDMELQGIFTRRDPENVKTASGKARAYQDLKSCQDEIDVLVLCGGSKTDIPSQGPELIQNYSTVDAFDTHQKIPEYFAKMDALAKETQHVAVLSTGWDPGLFSLQRVLMDAVLTQGETHTFWGPGLSQGHSEAVRRLPGVKRAVQYTVPNQALMERIRAGEEVEVTSQTAHKREVYLVLEDGADPEEIKEQIVSMPDYFAGYETHVHVIDEATFERDHQAMFHGGTVMRTGHTSEKQEELTRMEFHLELASNPEFTGAVNVAYARAAYRLAQAQDYGAKTVLDIPPRLISPRTKEELLAGFV